jgi:Hint module
MTKHFAVNILHIGNICMLAPLQLKATGHLLCIDFISFISLKDPCNSVSTPSECTHNSIRFDCSGRTLSLTTYPNITACASGRGGKTTVLTNANNHFGIGDDNSMSAHCLASETPLVRRPGDPSPGNGASNAPSTQSKKDCFAADELVENGDKIKISLVRVGDRILSASRSGRFSYADVVAVPHKKNDIEASFVVISTASSDLKLTADHYLMAGVCGSEMILKKASDVSVGSCVMTTTGSAVVTTTSVARGRGVYTVVSTEEFIVVNGIVASPFALNHYAADSFYNVFRTLYHNAPSLIKSNFVEALYDIICAVFESSA